MIHNKGISNADPNRAPHPSAALAQELSAERVCIVLNFVLRTQNEIHMLIDFAILQSPEISFSFSRLSRLA